MLPAHLRQEVERRLFQNGFCDYEELAQWVRDQGYNISDDSLWRYGRSLQQEMHTARMSALQAAALADLPDAQGSIAQTLVIIAQQKALEALLDQEELKPAVLNALARMMTTAQAISTAAPASASCSSASSSTPPAVGKPEPGTLAAAQPSRPAQLDRSQLESPQIAAHLTPAARLPENDSAAACHVVGDSLRLGEPDAPKSILPGDRGLLLDSEAVSLQAPRAGNPPSAPSLPRRLGGTPWSRANESATRRNAAEPS
jgi:hypothetical protein